MCTLSKILPLLILASALSLSSCVNEVKNPVKTQVQDTVSIIFNIPDSNKILTVDFHAAMTQPWQKNYRIDWNFGDSTGIISKFDTSNLTHYYQKNGTYTVSLSVFDTIKKINIGRSSAFIELGNNAIDTNFLHEYAKIQITFLSDTMGNFSYGNGYIPSLTWNGNYFQLKANLSWHDSINAWQSDRGGEAFTFTGHISYTGSKLDSGSFQYDYGNSYSTRVGRGEDEKSKTLNYILLPFQEKDSNTIKYSLNESALQFLVTQYTVSSYSWYNMNQGSNHFNKDMILWNQQPPPTLTVTFSK